MIKHSRLHDDFDALNDNIHSPPKRLVKWYHSPLFVVGIVIVLASIATLIFVVVRNDRRASPGGADNCPVFCHSDLLKAVQMGWIFNSSKTFVDMPMRSDPDVIEKKFHDLEASPDYSLEKLAEFVADNFDPPGTDMVMWNPSDFTDHPGFISRIANSDYRQLARDVNQLWKILGRDTAASVRSMPQRHSLLATKNPFIVPGGRFREVYYWDTYWIIRGLLTCDMVDTAKGMVENLLDFVNRFGFVPNGSRRYYLNRSQPPMLTAMVEAVFDHMSERETASRTASTAASASASASASTSEDDDETAGEPQSALDFLREALPLLDREYAYWMTRGKKAVEVEWDGKSYVLNRYYVETDHPRPESYREDVNTTSHINTEAGRNKLWAELAAGAETGWDYCSRWFEDRTVLQTIDTSVVIPVDLNSIMARNERTLARFHAMLGDTKQYARYMQAYNYRLEAMEYLLWEEDLQQWVDFRMGSETRDGPPGVLSNFAPLWARAYHHGINFSRVITALETSGLIQVGGMAMTIEQYGVDKQQWDWPNAWAPVQHMIIEGFDMVGTRETSDFALSLAQMWVNTNYVAFRETGYMFEKYDVRVVGGNGGGGEYEPQVGFGWSNGVLLSLLDRYASQLAPLNTTMDVESYGGIPIQAAFADVRASAPQRASSSRKRVELPTPPRNKESHRPSTERPARGGHNGH